MSEPLSTTPDIKERLISLALDGLASPHTRRAYRTALDELLMERLAVALRHSLFSASVPAEESTFSQRHRRRDYDVACIRFRPFESAPETELTPAGKKKGAL